MHLSSFRSGQAIPHRQEEFQNGNRPGAWRDSSKFERRIASAASAATRFETWDALNLSSNTLCLIIYSLYFIGHLLIRMSDSEQPVIIRPDRNQRTLFSLAKVVRLDNSSVCFTLEQICNFKDQLLDAALTKHEVCRRKINGGSNSNLFPIL